MAKVNNCKQKTKKCVLFIISFLLLCSARTCSFAPLPQKTAKTSDRMCKCSLVAFNEQLRKQGANAHLGNKHDMNW